ncbi:MAG TPA: hypothetical protein V6C50_00945 [Crinalium sp.]
MTSLPPEGSDGCLVAVLLPLAIVLTNRTHTFLTHDKLKQVTHLFRLLDRTTPSEPQNVARASN